MIKICLKVLFHPRVIELLFLIKSQKKEEEETYLSFFFLCQVVVAKP